MMMKSLVLLTCATLATLTEAVHLVIKRDPAAADDLSATSPEESASGVDGVMLTNVFRMCLVMYGGLALVWLLTRVIGVEDTGKFKIGILMISWASMSVGMHILNKSLVTCLDSPALISAVQMVIAAAAFAPRCIPELQAAPSSQVLRWCIVPIFFAAMLTTSFYAYEYMSLTLLTIVRNLSPLVALPLESAVMPAEKRPTVSTQAVLSVFVMLLGAMAYGGTNFESISFIGIAFAIVNMVVAISDRLIQRRLLTNECRDLSAGACTLINNSLGLLPTMMLAGATGQIGATQAHATNWTDHKVVLLLIVSGLVGIGISWLGLECQRVISATSFIVMQNASKVFVVLAGVLIFGDPMSSAFAVIGLVASLVGSWMYGVAQMQTTSASAKPATSGPAAAALTSGQDGSSTEGGKTV